jgi:hypothetical protein
VAHTLCQYVAAVSKDYVTVAMALMIPMLLSRAASEGGDVYRETSSRLLELASVDQAAFKGVVGGMSEGQKAFMEEVIRTGRLAGSGPRDAGGESGKPSIALKMDFGANIKSEGEATSHPGAESEEEDGEYG